MKNISVSELFLLPMEAFFVWSMLWGLIETKYTTAKDRVKCVLSIAANHEPTHEQSKSLAWSRDYRGLERSARHVYQKILTRAFSVLSLAFFTSVVKGSGIGRSVKREIRRISH